jgi:very-short-patch-repair endonuclease
MSELEATFSLMLQTVELPPAKREYRFHPSRKFRFDFAWPAYKVAVEVEGGVYTNGRHTTGKGFTADCEKYNEAACLGWRVLRVTGAQVNNGQALDWLERLMTRAE